MELNDKHIEAIKAAARQVNYGSVSIQIAEQSNHLDITVQNKIRIENEPTVDPNPRDRKGGAGYRV